MEFKMELKEKTNEIELNDGQQKAYETILEYYYNWENRNPPLIIEGQGGSGKTTTLCHALKRLSIRPSDILVMTMSHKANEVLRGGLEKNGISAKVQTLHKTFGWSMEKNSQNEDVVKWKSEKAIVEDLKKYKIIVIDEISLIDDLFVDMIKKFLLGKYRVILLGDSYQLPPVQEGEVNEDGIIINNGSRINGNGRKVSKIFSVNTWKRMELTKNMRADNPAIAMLNDLIRKKVEQSTDRQREFGWQTSELNALINTIRDKEVEGIDKIKLIVPNNKYDHNDLEVYSGDVLKGFLEVENGCGSVFLGGTNRYVDQRNFSNRLKISGKSFYDLKKIEAGETILAKSTTKKKGVEDNDKNDDRDDLTRVFASNTYKVTKVDYNQEFVIVFNPPKEDEEGVEKKKRNANPVYKLTGDWVYLNKIKDKGMEVELDLPFFCIDKSTTEWKRLQGAKYRLKKSKTVTLKQKEEEFNRLSDFVQSCLFYCHAQTITIHRSQGSTYNRVHVNFNTINSMHEVDFWQMLYVATSRAKKVLVLTGSTPIIGTNYDRVFSKAERDYICNHYGAKCYITGDTIRGEYEIEHLFPRNLIKEYKSRLGKVKTVGKEKRKEISQDFAKIVNTYYRELEDKLKIEISGFDRSENNNMTFLDKLHDLNNLRPVSKSAHLRKTSFEEKIRGKYEKEIEKIFEKL